MKFDFFLDEKYLPEEFIYPEMYVSYVSKPFVDMDPWHFFYSKLSFRYLGLKSRYPKRIMIPFARRGDNDDVACFDASTISHDPKVLLIHDFASEGWEYRGDFENFLEWLAFAKMESIEYKERR